MDGLALEWVFQGRLFNLAVSTLSVVLSVVSGPLGFFAGLFARRNAQNICGVEN